MYRSIPEWIEAGLLPEATASDIRRVIVQDIMATAGSELGLYYGVSIVDGEPHWTDVEPIGPAEPSRYLTQCRGRPLREFVDLKPSALTTVNAFSEVSVDEYRDNKMFVTMLEPMQVEWVLAMTALVDGVIVGWVGAYRFVGEQPFGRDVVRELQLRADSYIDKLESAHRLDGYAAGERGLVLLDNAGAVEFACANGMSWLDRPGFADRLCAAVVEHGATGSAVTHWLSGVLLRLTRVAGSERELYCAELQPVHDITAPAVLKLSKRKRQISELAMVGATSAEIASELKISPETVRTHLKQIYDELGVSSRIELRQQFGMFG